MMPKKSGKKFLDNGLTMKLLDRILKRLTKKVEGPKSKSTVEVIPTLVIAGSYDQFRNYVAENRLNVAGYRYICQAEDICGYKKVNTLRIGEYWKNPMDTAPELKLLEIMSEDCGKNVIPRDQLVQYSNGRYLKSDGSFLTMGNMGAQADQRNTPRLIGPLGSREREQSMNYYPIPPQGYAPNMIAKMGPAGPIPIGNGIGSAFGIEPLREPKKEPEILKKEPEIPMQQPTGKRKIKLRD